MEQEHIPRQKEQNTNKIDFQPERSKVASLSPPPFQLKASSVQEEEGIQEESIQDHFECYKPS